MVVSKPRERNVGTFDVGRVTGRPLDGDTQYGIRQFSARSSKQKLSLDKISH
jgi:hypothetical protein